MSSLLSWGGRFREFVAGLVVIPASLLLVQGCAAPQGPPVQLANDPDFKVMSFGDFVGESVSEEYRLLALEVAIPAKYEMTTLDDYAYWFPPERAAAVVESGDLPTDTGYFYSKVSLNVGYDAERKIFVGVEDRDPAAEMRQQGIEDFEWERTAVRGYPAIFTRFRDPSTKRTVHAAYIVSQEGSGVFYIAYVPPDGDPSAGAETWKAFRSALAREARPPESKRR